MRPGAGAAQRQVDGACLGEPFFEQVGVEGVIADDLRKNDDERSLLRREAVGEPVPGLQEPETLGEVPRHVAQRALGMDVEGAHGLLDTAGEHPARQARSGAGAGLRQPAVTRGSSARASANARRGRTPSARGRHSLRSSALIRCHDGHPVPSRPAGRAGSSRSGGPRSGAGSVQRGADRARGPALRGEPGPHCSLPVSPLAIR